MTLSLILLVGVLTVAEKPIEKPAWIDRAAHRQGTVYQVTVKSGLFVTAAECQRDIEPKLRSAIIDYLDEYLSPDAETKVAVDHELLDKLRKDSYLETVHSATVGPMRQLHVLLEFDGTARQEFDRRWQQSMVATRLRKLALGCGIVLGLLGVAVAYLKLDLLTSGQYRGRLKLGAAGAILLVMATAAAVRRALLH
jgi:hypothetical protein